MLRGRAWWSKASIVGRVFAASRNCTDCMAWIGVPDVVPISATSKKCLPDDWVNLHSEDVPLLREHSRIQNGTTVACESNPLGIRQGKVNSIEFRIPIEPAFNSSQERSIALDS